MKKVFLVILLAVCTVFVEDASPYLIGKWRDKVIAEDALQTQKYLIGKWRCIGTWSARHGYKESKNKMVLVAERIGENIAFFIEKDDELYAEVLEYYGFDENDRSYHYSGKMYIKFQRPWRCSIVMSGKRLRFIPVDGEIWKAEGGGYGFEYSTYVDFIKK